MSLTTVASGAAAGMIIVGILAIVGGSYAKDVIHDQLTPQQIFFPPADSEALYPDLREFAGEQVDDGEKAKAYAEKFIGRHLEEVAGGQTYAEVSQAAQADPENAELAAQQETLFRGETLRGLLLNAWGWGTVGSIATAAGIVLVVIGALLLILPLLNWFLNLRPARAGAAVQGPGPGGAEAG